MSSLDTPIQSTRNLVNFWIPRVTLIVLLVALSWTIVLMFWMFWPYDVIRLQNMEVLSEAYANGELVLKLSYCKSDYYGDLPSDVQYTYHDGLNYGLPGSSISILANGCHSSIEVIAVPPLPSGQYKVEMIRNYKVNLVRTMTYRIISNQFTLQAAHK